MLVDFKIRELDLFKRAFFKQDSQFRNIILDQNQVNKKAPVLMVFI